MVIANSGTSTLVLRPTFKTTQQPHPIITLLFEPERHSTNGIVVQHLRLSGFDYQGEERLEVLDDHIFEDPYL